MGGGRFGSVRAAYLTCCRGAQKRSKSTIAPATASWFHEITAAISSDRSEGGDDWPLLRSGALGWPVPPVQEVGDRGWTARRPKVFARPGPRKACGATFRLFCRVRFLENQLYSHMSIPRAIPRYRSLREQLERVEGPGSNPIRGVLAAPSAHSPRASPAALSPGRAERAMTRSPSPEGAGGGPLPIKKGARATPSPPMGGARESLLPYRGGRCTTTPSSEGGTTPHTGEVTTQQPPSQTIR